MRELGIALIAVILLGFPVWMMAVMRKGDSLERRFGFYLGGLLAVLATLAPVALLGPVAVWLVL